MNETTFSLAGIARHFESLPDPRHPRNIHHLLIDVIVIAVCGVCKQRSENVAPGGVKT